MGLFLPPGLAACCSRGLWGGQQGQVGLKHRCSGRSPPGPAAVVRAAAPAPLLPSSSGRQSLRAAGALLGVRLGTACPCFGDRCSQPPGWRWVKSQVMREEGSCCNGAQGGGSSNSQAGQKGLAGRGEGQGERREAEGTGTCRVPGTVHRAQALTFIIYSSYRIGKFLSLFASEKQREGELAQVTERAELGSKPPVSYVPGRAAAGTRTGGSCSGHRSSWVCMHVHV